MTKKKVKKPLNPHRYDRLGKVALEEVLPLIPTERIVLLGTKVGAQSLRLRNFKFKGLICVECGIEAQFFAVEKYPHDKGYHINLYSIDKDGIDVLMTRDHIKPKSKGGADDLANSQTMCTHCNGLKSDIWVEKNKA
jgi:hypothetical protein